MFQHLIFASALSASPAADCERLVSGTEPPVVALRSDSAPFEAAERLDAAPEPLACEEIHWGTDRVLVEHQLTLVLDLLVTPEGTVAAYERLDPTVQAQRSGRALAAPSGPWMRCTERPAGWG